MSIMFSAKYSRLVVSTDTRDRRYRSNDFPKFKCANRIIFLLIPVVYDNCFGRGSAVVVLPIHEPAAFSCVGTSSGARQRLRHNKS